LKNVTAKAVKISDIKGPDKVAPATTSRPLVVTNRPVIADPMMVAAKTENETEEPKAATRMTKVIRPMTLAGTDDEAEEDTKESTETEQQTEEKASDSGRTSVPLEQTLTPETLAEKPAAELVRNDTTVSEPEQRDTDAEAEHAKEQLQEAEIARQQELDTLITSGKYAVPVGAVRRRRSRMYIMLLCTVGLLLAILLLDAVFDAGIVAAPKNIPHTHFFTTN
jgi:hypothetical protein